MIKLMLRRNMVVDGKVASGLLEFNTYKLQRTLQPKWVQWLVKEIELGMFLTGYIVLARLVYENNRKIMVNGQHQSHAVLESGLPITVFYEEWSCENERDLSDLYSRFDGNRGRTLSDLLAPEAGALRIDWGRQTVNLVVAAAGLNDKTKGRIGGVLTKLERVSLLEPNTKAGDFVNNIFNDGKTCRHLRRAPVVRAMMDTYKVDKKAASIFWVNVRDGIMLPDHHPALKLRDYLKVTFTATSLATREMYVKCIHAWNAFVTHKRTALKFVPSDPVPTIKKRTVAEGNI